MPLLDISLVTRALIRTIKAYVPASGVWTGLTTWDQLPVSPLPPDQLEAGALGVHLYHLTEDGHFKNQPPPGADMPPVRFAPMGLNLYYQLSVNPGESEQTLYQAQLLLGLAVKALHDHPILADGTEVNGRRIFDEECAPLRNAENRLRLSLQPIAPGEATGFWTAGPTPLRLSAYYQASVVLLEPEEPRIRAGRVLRYGVQTFVGGAPRLDGSENTLVFAVPDLGPVQQFTLRPAEVPPGAGSASRVAFTGADLAGDETDLLLRSARWSEPRTADAAWGVSASSARVIATVQETVGGEDVLPGFYAASVRVVRHRPLADGSVRRIEQSSNETAFSIAPRIDDPLEAPDSGGVAEVRGYLFQHRDLDPGRDIQLYVGNERLSLDADGTLDRAEFSVIDGRTLRLRLPEGLASGTRVPLRLLVNGAESAPRWIEVPA